MDRRNKTGGEVKLHILGFHRNIQGNPMQDCVLKIMTLQSSKSLCGLLRHEEYRTVATVPIPWRENSVGEWVSKSGSSGELDTVFMFNKPYEVTILPPTGASTPTRDMTTIFTTNSRNTRQRARLVKAGQIQVRFVLKEDEDTIRSAKVMVDISKQHTQETQKQKGFMYKVIPVPAKKLIKWGPTSSIKFVSNLPLLASLCRRRVYIPLFINGKDPCTRLCQPHIQPFILLEYVHQDIKTIKISHTSR
ncbi:hypothetical protein Pcinc_027082 [Petrolisthes cinctipes]|uniref:Uncharacterized protein n=1 Tax=Petrolisthes cinctipes TaxID=88211 RepID=A0AAE1F4Z8_PETCI|nr:hypothetical protein Pcinc_027081 [Petrolisthes cinctipes]KAK3867448.1 hypothetical protein Pcinc_027082 [Petrolisthes cinctipes]